jgi:Alginate export
LSRIAFAALLAALLVHAGDCLAEEQEGEAPAAAAIGLPSAVLGGLTIQPTLGAGLAMFAQSNSWYGRSTANLDRNSDRWSEGYLAPGFGLTYELGGAGRVNGAFNLVGAFTHGTDAAGSNVGDETPTDAAVNQAWLGWNSASLFADALGEDAVDLSFGRQDFQLGQGFLFWDGSSNGGDRGAYWLAPRKAYQAAGVAKLETHGVTGRAFYLEPDDDPHTDTKLVGVDVEYALAEGACALDADVPNCLAVGYYNVLGSDIDTRDGMNVVDLRADARPSTALPGLRLAGEFAYEKNGDDLEAHGWFGELGYAATDLPWSPYLSYRYAFFSGGENASGKSKNFDPLFYDGPDWGTWTQGEILGEWVLSNSNLISHTVRLNAYPTDNLTLTALYYYFLLDDPGAAGVEDHDFAHEVDLAADYVVNRNLSVGVIAAVSVPEDAAKQYTGGDQTWGQLSAYTTITF